jgi:hypothetical protein
MWGDVNESDSQLKMKFLTMELTIAVGEGNLIFENLKKYNNNLI